MITTMETPKLLTLEQTAETFGVNPRTIRRLWYANEFPEPIRVGRGIRWRLEDIQKFVEIQAQPQATETEKELT